MKSLLSKPPEYTLIDRDGRRKRGNVSLEPSAIIALYRFKYKNTFSFADGVSKFKKGSSLQDLSVATFDDDPFFVQKWCLSVNTSRTRSSPCGQASVVLKDPTKEIFETVAPGDWIVIWFFDNNSDAQRIQTNIKNGRSANDELSGLKFIGRVTEIRRSINVQPNGLKDMVVSINAHSFVELNSNIYFDTAMLESGDSSNLRWISGALKDFLNQVYQDTGDKIAAINDVETAIFALVGAFLGLGPSRVNEKAGQKNKDSVSREIPRAVNTDVLVERTPNQAFLIPTAIGDILGQRVASAAGGQLTFADILTTLIGTQEFSLSRGSVGSQKMCPDPDTERPNPFAEANNMFYVGKPLNQKFNPQLVPYNNVPFWNILSSYLVPCLNEMYTGIRPNFEGNLVPTIAFRQIPFTTRHGSRYLKMNTTCFFDLPRWIIHNDMVLRYDVSRSDALRINMTRVIPLRAYMGTNPDRDEAVGISKAFKSLDELDIFRNGLRTKFDTVPADNENLSNQWSMVVHDFLAAGHLKVTGNIVCSGIQEAINPGDACVFDDILFYIETVEENVVVEDNGTRSFITTLSVTNGISLKSENDVESAEWPYLKDSTSDLGSVREYEQLEMEKADSGEGV